MNSIVGALLSFLLLYKYVALFILIFFSAVILPLPDSTILLATGAFASQGYFNIWISLAVVLIGNVCGDCFDYLLARRYGIAAMRHLRIKRTPWYLGRLDAYMRRHPGISIFFTRFVGTVDVIVNLLAGFADIPFWKFLLWDTVGNFVSLASILYFGYLLGIYWQDFSSVLSVVGFLLLAIVAVAVIIILAKRR